MRRWLMPFGCFWLCFGSRLTSGATEAKPWEFHRWILPLAMLPSEAVRYQPNTPRSMMSCLPMTISGPVKAWMAVVSRYWARAWRPVRNYRLQVSSQASKVPLSSAPVPTVSMPGQIGGATLRHLNRTRDLSVKTPATDTGHVPFHQ